MPDLGGRTARPLGGTVENEQDERERGDLSPDPVRVLELRALAARYGLVTAAKIGPCSEAERHLLATGHRLAFGCCRP